MLETSGFWLTFWNILDWLVFNAKLSSISAILWCGNILEATWSTNHINTGLYYASTCSSNQTPAYIYKPLYQNVHIYMENGKGVKFIKRWFWTTNICSVPQSTTKSSSPFRPSQSATKSSSIRERQFNLNILILVEEKKIIWFRVYVI